MGSQWATGRSESDAKGDVLITRSLDALVVRRAERRAPSAVRSQQPAPRPPSGSVCEPSGRNTACARRQLPPRLAHFFPLGPARRRLHRARPDAVRSLPAPPARDLRKPWPEYLCGGATGNSPRAMNLAGRRLCRVTTTMTTAAIAASTVRQQQQGRRRRLDIDAQQVVMLAAPIQLRRRGSARNGELLSRFAQLS